MSFHLYGISELFSNADGTVQYIELSVGPFNGENFWAGHSIAANQGGTIHSFTFPSNLPSSSTANTTVLIATQAFANLGLVTPDFIVPSGFLFTNGGTVTFAGLNSVSYAALPTDGSHAIDASGSIVSAVATNFAGLTAPVVLASSELINGTAAAESLLGTDSSDAINGLGGNDTLTGGGGNDTLDGGTGIDTALYSGDRAEYALSKSASAYAVADASVSRDGADNLTNVELVVFADRTVDLGAGARAQTIDAATLKTLQELYVGFFNRIPEASGLGFWIDQIHGGLSLTEVANQFYSAGVAFEVYSASMTNAQFIQAVYANVLYRPQGSANEPNAQEIGYWNSYLTDVAHPEQTKGTMVLQMLHDVHAHFETDPVFGFVAASLNNKAAVANYYAVQQGLSLNVQQDNVAFGIALAALITPTDTSAAIALVGLSDTFATT